MSNKAISVRSISRFPETGQEEALKFHDGVNVVVGPPNTGKSRWLQMTSFLLGETGTAQNAFGEEMANKYSRLTGVIRIDNEDIQLERRWKEHGLAGSVLVNGERYTVDNFSNLVLTNMGLPIVHVPKGNPYGPKRWPVLSWRSLFRHMFRQWRFWADLADKQPDGDQLACLLMFLGVAELAYPEEYDLLVQKNKEKLRLEAAKDEFTSIFTTLYKQIVEGGDNTVTPTAETIPAASSKLSTEIAELQERRDQLLSEIVNDAVSTPSNEYFSSLSAAWDEHQVRRDQLHSLGASADKRYDDLLDYQNGIDFSLRKLNRTMSAASVLSDIRITVCPACDQPVHQIEGDTSECFLCHQPLATNDSGASAPNARLQFEIDQLISEREEAESLISAVVTERDQLRQDQQQAVERLRDLERQMEPLRRAAANITPPELRDLDFQIGRLHQQMQTLERLQGVLDKRDDHSSEIDMLSAEIDYLYNNISKKEARSNLEQKSQDLSDAMNDYLSQLNEQVRDTWTQDEIKVRVKEKSFQFRVGNRPWQSQLGGTLTHYFLLSYHFGLLSLTPMDGFMYPGFAMIDFPPAMEDSESIADKENFVLNPFVGLLNNPSMKGCQVIAAGAAFEGLEGANRIQLSEVWK